MLSEVAPATEADDGAVASFLEKLGVAVPSAFWGRAFSPESPDGVHSSPFLVRSDTGEVVAFAAVRPCVISGGGDPIESQVLHDFFVCEGKDGDRAAEVVLADLARRAVVTVSAGASERAARALGSAHWHEAGAFSRWRFKPAPDAAAKLPDVHPQALLEAWEKRDAAIAAQDVLQIARPPAVRAWQLAAPETGGVRCTLFGSGNFAVAREAKGEWHIVDFGFEGRNPEKMFRAIGSAFADGERTAYLSFHAPWLDEACSAAGWEQLRSRWPVYWVLGEVRHRAVADVLSSRRWFITPLDVELDR